MQEIHQVLDVVAPWPPVKEHHHHGQQKIVTFPGSHPNPAMLCPTQLKAAIMSSRANCPVVAMPFARVIAG